MPVIIKKIDNSFIQIKNVDINLSRKLKDNFSFFTQNYRFHPKYKSGLWNGQINLFNIQTGKLPFGLAKRAIKIVREYTTDVVIDFSIFDKGLDISKEEILNFCKKIKFEHIPYDHQIEATLKCLKSKRMTIESATSSGKSLNLFLVSNFLMMNNKDEKILIIVPTVQLVKQLSKDFVDYAKNWKKYDEYIHEIYSGQSKDTDKQITISTYQSLIVMTKNGDVGLEYFKQFTTMMVDECQIIFSNLENIKSVNKIINNCSNAENKFGFSGSLLNSHSTEMQLNGLFGPVKRIVNAKDLIDAGILAKFKIKSIILEYSTDRKIELKSLIDNVKKNQKVETQKYNCEISYIREISERFDFLISFCTKIKKNTIVLFKSIDYGNKIYKELYKHSGKRVYFIDGTVPVLKREEIRENMEKYDNCVLVGSIGTISTGINIKNVYNCVIIESIKSEIKIIQSIGRILRKLEGKESVLYDIADNLSLRNWSCYSMRHLKSRLNTYSKEHHSVKILKMRI